MSFFKNFFRKKSGEEKNFSIAFLSERYSWQVMFSNFFAEQKRKAKAKLEACWVWSNEQYIKLKKDGKINQSIWFFEARLNDKGDLIFTDIIKDIKKNFPDILLVGISQAEINRQKAKEAGADETISGFLEDGGASEVLTKRLESLSNQSAIKS